MTAEQQLERSVLEGKERDELSAIAQAMSFKTTTRTKKADIIDQILDATGVTSGSAGEQSNGDGGDAGANGSPSRPGAPERGAATEGDGVPRRRPGDGRRRWRGRRSDRRRRRRRGRADVPPRGGRRATANSGPAVFVEPPELADGADPAPRQNGQTPEPATTRATRATRTARTTSRATRTGTRETRTGTTSPRATSATAAAVAAVAANVGQGGELQGGGQEQPYTGELVEVKRHARPARRGLRVPPLRGLPAVVQGRVRLHQPGAASFALRRGDYVEGACRPASNNEKYPALLRIDTVSVHGPRRGAQPAALRGPHPALPRLTAQPRDAWATRTT